MRPEYSAWRFSFTILLYYSTVLTLSKNFHILSRFNVNEMGPHWVLFFYCTLIVVHSWPVTAETCSQYHLIVIFAFCLMYVVYWRCIKYYMDLIIHNGMASLKLTEISRLEYQSDTYSDKYRWTDGQDTVICQSHHTFQQSRKRARSLR